MSPAAVPEPSPLLKESRAITRQAMPRGPRAPAPGGFSGLKSAGPTDVGWHGPVPADVIAFRTRRQ
jgi:hypothetical protein